MSNISLNEKNKKLKLDNKNLDHASKFAIFEALHWDETADIILAKNNLRSQACVCALFSIEIFLKAILMSDDINVQNKRYGHNIYNLFNDINESLKKKINSGITIDKKVCIKITNDEIEFNNFEEELEYIANDFMYLRYEYEKFLNGYPIITFF